MNEHIHQVHSCTIGKINTFNDKSINEMICHKFKLVL